MKIIIAFLIFLSVPLAAAEKHQILFIPFTGNTPKAESIASGVEAELSSKLLASGDFYVNLNEQLKNQISKSELTRKEIISFAAKAGFAFYITGTVTDNKDHLMIQLLCYGVDHPYSGNLIAVYSKKIDLANKTYSKWQFNNFAKEHASLFYERIIDNFYFPVYLSGAAVSETAKKETTYRSQPGSPFYEKIEKGQQEKPGIGKWNIFVLRKYSGKPEKSFITSKKELLVESGETEDLLFAMLFTPALSTLAPLAAPMGYYSNEDYSGLFLWSLNAAPYYFAAYKGIRPEYHQIRYHDKITGRFENTNSKFLLYHMAFGSIAFIADSISANHVEKGRDYNHIPQYSGNNQIAAYLSVLGGGSALFYKGWRGWGYFYWHVDNILAYSLMYTYYGHRNHTFDTNRNLYIFAGAFVVSRIVQLIHSSNLEYNIENGKNADEPYVGLSPELCVTEKDRRINMNFYVKF